MRTTGILVVVVLIAVFAYRWGRIPDVSLTASSIRETFVRIHLHGVEHGEVPKSLDVLPVRENYANRIGDAWGRDLIYDIGDGDVLTLTSLGRDGVPGGDGDDRDQVVRYRARRPDGSLWVGDEMWIVDAEIR